MGTRKYPVELRERAVRLYRESDPKPVIRRLAEQLNVHPEALRNWIRQAEADAGERDDRPMTAMIEENRRLARENAELRRVNEVLRAASAYFVGDRPDPEAVMSSLMRMTSRSISYCGSWASRRPPITTGGPGAPTRARALVRTPNCCG